MRSSSLLPPRRLAPVILVAFTVASASCAGGRLQLSALEPSASNSDGSRSDGSKSDKSSDGSKSDNSKTNNSQSDGSSQGSSDTHSETSGTVTTRGSDQAKTSAVGLYILTGALILGATTLGAVLLLNQSDEPAAYLRRHDRGIRLALVRGEGPFVLDVADNLGLPPTLLPLLGQTLRGARKTLEPHLVPAPGETIATEDGERFAEALARALEAEPALAPYVKAIMKEVELLVAEAPVAP